MTDCYNCKSPLPVFSYICGICGANNTPVGADLTPVDLSDGGPNMSNNWSEYSLNGCLFEDAPKPSPMLGAPSADLPQRIDLRLHCPPVESQLTTNSCVANAVVGALEIHQKKAGLPLTDMSRLFVYYNARSLAGNQMRDVGSLIHHGMAAVLAYGACEERLWPFEPAMVMAQPPANCYENAMQYEAVQYARTPRGAPALAALAQGLPVVFGMSAPAIYYEAAAQTGAMPRPDQLPPQVQPPSGHAMIIVGYDLADKTYLVRNSWGPMWADRGYCRIPFETMDTWARAEEFWTIGAIEQAEGFALSGPNMIDAMKGVGVPQATLDTAASGLGRLKGDLRARLSSDLETAKRDFKKRLRD